MVYGDTQLYHKEIFEKKSLNLNFENISNYLEKSAKVKFINSSVVQNSAEKESCMACEVNAE